MAFIAILLLTFGLLVVVTGCNKSPKQWNIVVRGPLPFLKEKKRGMKKWGAFLLATVMLLSLCACGGDSSATGEESAIKVKGTFLLNPSDELDLSADGLASVQRYLLVVYDVANSGDSNEELSGFDDSVTVTFNDKNRYDQLYGDYSSAIRNFIANSGYDLSTSYGTLWGGSDPVRMIAAFAINENDMKEGYTATINFELSRHLTATAKITAEDVQAITLFDGIFAVEEDPDAYQIAHSVKARAQICLSSLKEASQAEQRGDKATRALKLALCAAIFSEDAVWGVSCGGTLSEELPTFKLESVRLYYPEIADKIESVSDSIDIMNTELDQGAPDYDRVNAAQNSAYDTLTEIIDYFDAS